MVLVLVLVLVFRDGVGVDDAVFLFLNRCRGVAALVLVHVPLGGVCFVFRVLWFQGLDSSSAAEVMLLARRLAAAADRRAVVASVHQPSADMFSLFDKVRRGSHI